MKPFGQRHAAEVKKHATGYANLILDKNEERFVSREADADEVAEYMKRSEARVALLLQKGLK